MTFFLTSLRDGNFQIQQNSLIPFTIILCPITLEGLNYLIV